MGYDRAIVTFSPDGRLYQVEYAREAVKRGTTLVGVVFGTGIVIATIRPAEELSVPSIGSDKVHEIDSHIAAGMAGFLADGRVLIDFARVRAQVHKLTYDEPLSVLGGVKEIADRMQLYTQYGGVRPYGVGYLFGGIDENGPQLFEIDPSSAFSSWNAQAIGRGAAEALKILRKDWKEKMSKDAGIELALKALKGGEKGVKMNEIELCVVDNEGFVEYRGENVKLLKKYW
ncbi:MAG: archaeal proteasome endopeptidase complex subunit alpha [Candidatus Aenigmarchaeota archaeon]|nr:archaeal proteasome endopeptidase complex subunit alpha [Candidatus Aenigmarchaeota archaeon]